MPNQHATLTALATVAQGGLPALTEHLTQDVATGGSTVDMLLEMGLMKKVERDDLPAGFRSVGGQEIMAAIVPTHAGLATLANLTGAVAAPAIANDHANALTIDVTPERTRITQRP